MIKMKPTAGCSLLLAACFAVAAAYGQDTLPIQMDVDYAAFAFDDHQSLMEVYLAFEASSLTYAKGEVGYRARLPVDLSLKRSTVLGLPGTPGDPVWQDSIALEFVVPDTSSIVPGQRFIHQVRAVVPPGEYVLDVAIPTDPGAQRAALSLRRDAIVPDFSNPNLVGISDLTLATDIRPSSDRGDLFYKNGLIVRPNANQLFGNGLSRLFYYAETYHLSEAAVDADTYTLLVYVAEVNLPQPLPGMEHRTRRPVRSPDVIVGQFDVSGLPSGSYFLRMALLNDANEALAEQSRKFFVYNPGVKRAEPPALEVAFENSPYAAMSEEEVKQAFRHIDLIASEQERRRIKKLRELEARQHFLMNFWNKRDPNPSTPTNEFKDEFYQRVQYANDRYTSRSMEGWETDRGRILVKYGLPTSIEPHLFDRGVRPYEVW